MNFLCPVYCFAHCNAQTTTEPQYCPQKAAMRYDIPDYCRIMTLTLFNQLLNNIIFLRKMIYFFIFSKGLVFDLVITSLYVDS